MLIVEDDAAIARGMSVSLEREGYDCIVASTLPEARDAMQNLKIHLAILDINLDQEDGRNLCQELRADPANSRLPIIFVTVRADIDSKLSAFSVGADDFLCKPFESKELVARMRALFRRLSISSHEQASVCDKIAEIIKRIRFELTRTEAKILDCLHSGDGRFVSRESIQKSVWSDLHLSPKTIDAHINNLRLKVKPHGLNIQNRYKIGYRLSL